MDHRPFEDWLLEETPLNSEQKRDLNKHLRACTTSAALAEVNLALRSAKQAEPAAGFTERFQVRLVAEKLATRRRNAWGFVILTLSVVGVVTWAIWPMLKELAQSPVAMFSSWTASLSALWASLQAIFRAGLVLIKVAPGFVPVYVWAVILVTGGGLSAAWVVSLMKYSKTTQGVQA